MSSMRMCDRCNVPFSELEDGWETFQITRVDEDDDGRKVTKTEARDSCPRCAMTKPPRGLRRNERIEELLEQALDMNVIPALAAGDDLDRRERELRIAEKEKALGIGAFAPLSQTEEPAGEESEHKSDPPRRPIKDAPQA